MEGGLPAWYGEWPAALPIPSNEEVGTEKHPKGLPKPDQHLVEDPTL